MPVRTGNGATQSNAPPAYWLFATGIPFIIAPIAAPWTNAATVEPRKKPRSHSQRMRSLRWRNSNAMPRKISPKRSSSTGM